MAEHGYLCDCDRCDERYADGETAFGEDDF